MLLKGQYYYCNLPAPGINIAERKGTSKRSSAYFMYETNTKKNQKKRPKHNCLACCLSESALIFPRDLTRTLCHWRVIHWWCTHDCCLHPAVKLLSASQCQWCPSPLNSQKLASHMEQQSQSSPTHSCPAPTLLTRKAMHSQGPAGRKVSAWTCRVAGRWSQSPTL